MVDVGSLTLFPSLLFMAVVPAQTSLYRQSPHTYVTLGKTIAGCTDYMQKLFSSFLRRILQTFKELDYLTLQNTRTGTSVQKVHPKPILVKFHLYVTDVTLLKTSKFIPPFKVRKSIDHPGRTMAVLHAKT
ncbi:hypothetical protein ILYODFUR_002407 [Ilyodon furcidens]|uniref:Secreted protein n=1 Tax=Ilyodon furcidens TaxID=33524 RepID=A0ABV0V1B9_9TELE